MHSQKATFLSVGYKMCNRISKLMNLKRTLHMHQQDNQLYLQTFNQVLNILIV